MRATTLQDLIDRYKHRPSEIVRAIIRAYTLPDICHAVTKTSLRVLAAMMTRMNKKNGLVPIHANADRLAIEAECSERSVRRAIEDFRERGWLLLDAERYSRDDYGQFERKNTYWFSESFCDLVCLPYPGVEPAESATAATLSNGAVYVDLSFKNDLRKISEEQTKTRGFDLPTQLKQAAAEFSIAESGIAKLRGIAHRAGVKLESVIAVARTYLLKGGLTKNRAYRYLERLIATPSDYDGRAAQLQRQEAADAACHEQVENFLTEFAGRVFETEGGRELIAVQAAKRQILHRVNGVDTIIPVTSMHDVRHWRTKLAAHGLVERGKPKAEPANTPVQDAAAAAMAASARALALALVKANRGACALGLLARDISTPIGQGNLAGAQMA